MGPSAQSSADWVALTELADTNKDNPHRQVRLSFLG